MAVNVRCNKRVSDPFNERFRARIFSSISSSTSSGSEHDAETDLASASSSLSSTSTSTRTSTSTSVCLSYLVQNFLENNNSPTNTTTTDVLDTAPTRDSSDSDSDEFLRSDPTAIINDVIIPTVYNNADHFRNELISHVTKASEIFAFFRKKDKSIYLRNLMSYLREIGYDAAVCKTKWDASAGGTLTAGKYEFIDVLRPNSSTRYVIDLDFRAEFEIARATESFEKVRSSLPSLHVGRVDDVKKIVRVMCDEARRSMKINGLSLPPWRRNRYMQLKWLGKYRRTTNCYEKMMPVVETEKFSVKCRCVGFDVVGGGKGGRFMYPPVTRTR